MEPFALYETARVNDLAIAHELRQMDHWEAAALETLAFALGQPNPDIAGCQRIVAKLRARDQHENRLHSEIAEPYGVTENAGRAASRRRQLAAVGSPSLPDTAFPAAAGAHGATA